MSPSDMIKDQPVHMDRVRAIEATMDEMKSQHEATHQLLQDVLARLSPAQAHVENHAPNMGGQVRGCGGLQTSGV